MAHIDPRSLDYSDEMRAYFHQVERILVDRFQKSPVEARELVGRFFAIDVDPLERAFLMHTSSEIVAEDLAGSSTQDHPAVHCR